MNHDYLWDRSGEIDTEVRELEEILGTLRHQLRPLDIPVNLRPGRRYTFFPALAIAAAIALATLAFGFWLSFSRRQANQPLEAKMQAPVPERITPESNPGQASAPSQSPRQMSVQNSDSEPPTKPRLTGRKPAANLAARNPGPGSISAGRRELTAEEQAEKDQLMLALRMVSAKLNVAQRKAQGAPPLNVIRNQHPIG